MIIVGAVVGGATAAIAASSKLSGGRKKIRQALVARGLTVHDGAAGMATPATELVPKRAKGAAWSARVEGGMELSIYAAKSGPVIAAWRSKAPAGATLVLYQAPGTGNWFHRHLQELKQGSLPRDVVAYTDGSEVAIGLALRGAAAAFAQHVGTGGRSWCVQLVDGSGYLLAYDDAKRLPDLDQLIAGAAAIEASLGG